MNKVMSLIKSMLIPNAEGVFSINEAKKKTGFVCYDINLNIVDVKAINACLIAEGFDNMEATLFEPEKYGDTHRLFVGPKGQRKEADVSAYFTK
tara:strand:- start:699 stop:980 length:282 start_codon:yes stop_codon:yes gene_type:complete